MILSAEQVAGFGVDRDAFAIGPMPGAKADVAELSDFLAGKVARWQVPEYWTFVAEIPKTAVGKFDKKVLRARYAAGELVVEPR